jgi:hypothetical protein
LTATPETLAHVFGDKMPAQWAAFARSIFDGAKRCTRMAKQYHDAALLAQAASSLGLALDLRDFAASHTPATIAAELLRGLGFAPDLGPSWARDLPDGTTIQIAGYDASGEEPDEPAIGAPAFANLLRDPWDHSTLIETVERATLAELIPDVCRWIDAAGKVAP